MKTKYKSIRNNIFSITFAQILSLIFNIITFGIAARILSVSDFGLFNYNLAIIGFTAKIIDLGINPIVFRETSKNNAYDKYLGSALATKFLLIILLIVIINTYAVFARLATTTVVLLNLFAINIFFSNKYTNIRELLITPYKTTLRMSIPMILILLDNVLLLLLTLSLNFFNNKLITFAFFYVIANLPSTIILFWLLIKKEKIHFKFEAKLIKSLILTAFPIYGYVVLNIIYKQLDVILLGSIKGADAVAIYSAAVRLSSPFVIFASAITMTFFPIIVKKLENKENINNIVSSVIKILIAFSFTIAMLIVFNAKIILYLVFGEKYIYAELPLQLLITVMTFSFLNFFLVDLLTALNKQKYNFIYAAILLAITTPLYFILLPKFSYNGAALTKLFAIFIGTIFLIYNTMKKVSLNINLIRFILWIGSATLIFIFLSKLNFWIAIPLQVLTLIVLLFILQIFSYSELEIIFTCINKKHLLTKFATLLKK